MTGRVTRVLAPNEEYVMITSDGNDYEGWRRESYCVAKLIDVRGDGNCFFRALVEQLRQVDDDASVAARLGIEVRDIERAHYALRQRVAQHVDTYRSAPATQQIAADALMVITTATNRKTSTWPAVQALLARDQTYDNVVYDQLVLDLTSDALNCPIMVVQGDAPPHVAGYAPPRRAGTPLVIYRRGDHFLSVRRDVAPDDLLVFME